MKTIADPETRGQLRGRIEALSPKAQRQWGSMSAHQMICHLTDSFRLTTGEKTASPAQTWVYRTIGKFVALSVPLPWPKGVATRPEMDQHVGGTPPAQFEADKQTLLAYYDRFTRQPRDYAPGAHPLFGEMTPAEWDRWAYLHIDHHLRQFGQ